MAIFASIEDLKREAKRRVPKPFFEYYENGAYMETTLKANRAGLDAIKLRQHMLGGVAQTNTSTTLLGQPVSMPLALSPVGLCGMSRARGEILAAEAAKAAGVPFCLSTFSIAAIEDVAQAVGGDFWFQLYPMKDPQMNLSLMARAARAGVKVLVVTIDSQIEGTRYRDVHNGLGVPPELTPGNVWSVVSHPRWAFGMLRSPHFTFGNMIGETSTRNLGTVAKMVKGALLPNIDSSLLRFVRAHWKGALVIKGVFDERDAKIACDVGADAIIVSNHGGRSLDGVVATTTMLPRIRSVIPDTLELYADSGVRTGIDVMRLLGLGARACFIGRPYVYALGAAGKRGVSIALEIFRDDLERVMRMTGMSDVGQIPRTVIDD
jgi:L-lactate dehydrogenase (cytochrome)